MNVIRRPVNKYNRSILNRVQRAIHALDYEEFVSAFREYKQNNAVVKHTLVYYCVKYGTLDMFKHMMRYENISMTILKYIVECDRADIAEYFSTHSTYPNLHLMAMLYDAENVFKYACKNGANVDQSTALRLGLEFSAVGCLISMAID